MARGNLIKGRETSWKTDQVQKGFKVKVGVRASKERTVTYARYTEGVKTHDQQVDFNAKPYQLMVIQQADAAGAIYDHAGRHTNSTFVTNSANDSGGAIHGATLNSILFNTFIDNMSDSDFGIEEKQSLGESLHLATGDIVGNIFAGDSQYPQITFYGGEDNLEYNLSTGDDFDGVASNRGNVPISDFGFDSELRDNGTENFSQTLSISSSSAAFGFVPLGTAKNWLGDNPTDQRGTFRTSAKVNAGAFEEFVSQTRSVAAPTYFVFDVKPATTGPKPVINISGWEMMKITEVYVDGKKVEILSQSATGISFKLPFKAKGPTEIRLVGAGLEHIHILNLAGAIQNEAVVPGFGSNSTKLTKAMKNEIKAFVELNAGLTTVTCKGYTSAPATRQDLRLAKQRGQETCDYIKSLYPELTVKVLAGAHTNTPGQKVRRVRLEMQ
jgi:hypothetical protein